jgi:hypothetical protein
MNFITRWIDRIVAFGVALLFMQAPQFIQNYTQVLAGHLAELSWQLGQMRLAAEQSGKTLAELAAKFLHSLDPDIATHGSLIQKMIFREHDFTAALTALTHATALTRPFAFIAHAKWELIRETATHFQAGLPLSIEAILWGLAGLFLGYGLIRGIIFIIRKLVALKPH